MTQAAHTRDRIATPAQLRRLLDYNPETGVLTWRAREADTISDDRRLRQWNTRYAGTEALTASHSNGYRVGSLFGVAVRAHRVAYAIYYGEWPVGDVDHINGDRTDNRIANLRAVTRQQNCHNSAMRGNNTSGHSGVYWHKKNAMWHARITVGGHRKCLGYHHDIAAAIAARKAAQSDYGFTVRHGAILAKLEGGAS